MNGMLNWITTFLFIVGVILIIVKMMDDEEPYHALKL